MLLKYLSWPVAVIVIALVVIFVFKRSLNTILQRGGLKIGGLSIDANTAAAVASAQSESTSSISDSLSISPDSETSHQLATVKRISVSLTVRAQEDRILADIDKFKLSNTTETINLLVRHLAVYQLYHAAEQLCRTIFGSQIAVLKRMNFEGPMNRDAMRKFYDEAAEKFPMLYNKYPFESYVNFLKNHRVVTTNDDINYAITALGKEFLQWMVMEGATDIKPF
jgi:hypothetical protein